MLPLWKAMTLESTQKILNREQEIKTKQDFTRSIDTPYILYILSLSMCIPREEAKYPIQVAKLQKKRCLYYYVVQET